MTLAPQSTVAAQPRRTAERLARLAETSRTGQWSLGQAIDWRVAPRIPFWITRRQARAAISQLHHGELATSRVCRALLDEIEPGPAHECLAFQIADELRHAAAYERYLVPLGGLAPMHDGLARALAAATAGPFGPLGAVVAFHVVLEGEVLRLQGILARLLPCPLLQEINRRVARDEARHVAFGRIYLAEALAEQPPEARVRLHAWVGDLWRETTEPALARYDGPGVAHRALRRWLGGGWRHHEASLRQIGLGPAAEAERVR